MKARGMKIFRMPMKTMAQKALRKQPELELESVLDLAARMKAGDYRDRPLEGGTLAMILAADHPRLRARPRIVPRARGSGHHRN